MIASLGLRESSLRMVRDGSTLSPSSYTRAPGSRSRGREALVDPALVYKRYEDGATIVLEGLQRYWEPLSYFCRDLEQALGHRLQVNSYITPPGSQGFAAHSDDHDVFVLQVAGSKRWLVYDRDDGDRLLIEHEIEAGDALYIPKGFPHAAKTGRRASAHLTVGILTHDASDVVREIVKTLEKQDAFAERLSNDAARDPDVLRAEVGRVLGELRLWLDKVDVDEVTTKLARRFMSTSQPVVRGQLRQLELLETLDETSVVARRRGSTCVVSRTGEALVVLLSDRELTMPLVAERALQHIAAATRLTARDLHPFIDPASALVLVRRLVREGLLEVAP